jgi:LuxR family maltose regulon positive regulatory protein
MGSLLATKLHPPFIPPKRVQRPHLIRRLNEGLALGRRITLVSAPAGFGKTTCVGEWVDGLDRPFTWLSLDPGDDDPAPFFAYVVAALQKVDPTLGREIEGVLRSGQLSPGEIISTALVNDILGLKRRFLLVLDDFQVIQDRFILEVLENVLANPPPSLHLVLLTREDPPLPLARLRANNQLTEIRARDLRFSAHEADRFLNEVMELSLSGADIAALEEKTEGWIVGLQLAGLSVRGRADPSDFIAGLSDSHRFILGYLTEQVLITQPEEIQRFMLQTSILDRLNGDLCDAVTGRSDGHDLLERLFNANLFLIPLDDEGRWYRYHHLFADLLRDRQNTLESDQIGELHRRASRWYARAGSDASSGSGERAAFVGEAVRHALAAEDYTAAVDMLESHAADMVMQGYAQTVNGWVQAIPPEWRSQSPRTNLAFAWMHLLRGAYAQAFPYLDWLEATLETCQVEPGPEEERSSLKAEWLAMQSLLLNKQGKATKSRAAAARALEIAPEEDNRVRSLAWFGMASGYVLTEDSADAVEAYRMAIQYGRAAQNSVAELMSVAGLAGMALYHGQLHLALEIASQAVDRIERSGLLPPISAVVYGTLGEAYYQLHQLEDAGRHIVRATELSRLGGYGSGRTYCRVLLSRLFQIEGDLDAAAREIQRAVDVMQVDAPDDIRQELAAQQVRVYLAQNRPAAARMVLQGEGFSFQDQFSFPDLPPDQSIPHSLGLLYNGSLRLLLYQAQARGDATALEPGIDLADRLIAGTLRGQYLLAAIESLLLRAQMCAALAKDPGSRPASRRDCARADYARALELAETEGIIGVFVEGGSPVAETLEDLLQGNELGTVQPGYVERILTAFPRSQPPGTTRREQPAPGALIEPLTERELDVLRSMAEGLTYKEIAARLFISLNTVRFHVKAIYGKLGVNNRTQALATARQLRLL